MLRRDGFNLQDGITSLTPVYMGGHAFKSLVEGRNTQAVTLIRLSNKYVRSMMRTLERERVSWGQALWRKVKELGLTDRSFV